MMIIYGLPFDEGIFVEFLAIGGIIAFIGIILQMAPHPIIHRGL